MDAGNYLRALMRDVAWGFFYGWVNFDDVVGTVNHYQSVDLYAGSYNGTMKEAGIDLLENFPTAQIRATFEAMLDDWTNESFDPFSAPQETGSPYGRKNGNNTRQDHPGARTGQALRRPEGRPATCAATTRGAPVNRAFADVPQDAARAASRARLRERGACLQPVRLPEPLAGHLEPELHLGGEAQLHVPDHRRAHPADHPRQRPRRVVLPDDRRDPLGLRRQEHRQAAWPA